MKKYGLRVLVGLIAFAIGVGAVIWVFQFNLKKNYISQVRHESDYSNSFVSIKFKGFREKENKFVNAEFEITNNSSMTMYYRSRWKEMHEYKVVSVNGKQGVGKGYCGNVAMQMKEFSIEPNETNSFNIDFWDFRQFSATEKNQNVKVGYDFRFGEFDNYKTFWSENFELPKSVKEEIKKYQ